MWASVCAPLKARAEEGDVVVVGVKDILHRLTTEPDGILDVGCVDVFQLTVERYFVHCDLHRQDSVMKVVTFQDGRQ